RFCYYSNSDQETNISKLLDDFEALYPHIHVDRMTVHFQEYNELEHHMFDVIMLNYNNFRLYHRNNLLHLLSEQTADEQVYPFLNQAFTVGGALYVKPFVFSPVVLCYNKQHFEEANLPEPDSSWTWNEFCDAVAKLTNTDLSHKRLGFYFHLLSM